MSKRKPKKANLHCEIRKSTNGWYWKTVSRNGNVTGDARGYNRKADAIRAFHRYVDALIAAEALGIEIRVIES